MKNLMIIVIIFFCFGCVTPPQRPNLVRVALASCDNQLTMEQKLKIHADYNKDLADYEKTRAEYEQTASYKSTPYLLAPLLILGSAANGLPLGPASHGYGYRGSGKVVINSTPTAGGGYRTTIDPMY